MASRPKNYKSSASGIDDLRKKRGEATERLRKSKRDEELLKRRNLQPVPTITGGLSNEEEDKEEAMDVCSGPAEVTIDVLREGLMSVNVSEQLAAARHCRILVTTNSDEGIGKLVHGNVVADLVQLATIHQFVSVPVLIELVWTLTNVASGTSEHTASIVRAGGIPVLVDLLASQTVDPDIITVFEHTLWALGNIAGDDSEQFICRRHLLTAGAIPAVIRLLSNHSQQMSLVRNALWLLSNLCRSKSSPPELRSTEDQMLAPLVPVLLHFMENDDEEIAAQACRAVGHLISSKSEQLIGDLLQAGVAVPLVHNLSHRKASIVLHAVRSVGNLLTGDDNQTQVLIDAGAVPPLQALLLCQHEQICRSALLAVSNITAGNRMQIQALVDSKTLPKVIKLMLQGNRDVVKEALWAVSNVLHGGSRDQIRYLTGLSCHVPLAKILKSGSPNELYAALDMLGRFVKVDVALRKERMGSSGTDFATSFAECGGVDSLWKLVNSKNDKVSELADQLLTRYFSDT